MKEKNTPGVYANYDYTTKAPNSKKSSTKSVVRSGADLRTGKKK